jgi:Na+/melibiose symporter-like transporter
MTEPPVPVNGSFDEEKFKRPILRWSQTAALASLHFSVSAQAAALCAFVIPRATFVSIERGHMAEAQGMLWLVVAVVSALACPAWAALSDRRASRSFGRRRPYIVLGTVVCALVLVVLSVGGYRIPVAWYILFLVCHALGASCMTVAWQALCAEVVRKEQAGRVYLWRRVWAVVGVLLGAGVVPCIADFIRIPTVYALLIAVMIACNVSALRVNEPTRFTVPPSFRLSTAWADLLEPFQSGGGDYTLSFLARFLVDVAWAAFLHLTMYFVVDGLPKLAMFGRTISSPIVATGIVFVFAGACGLPGIGLSRMVVGRWGSPKVVLYIAGLLMAAACCSVVLLQASYAAALVFASAFGFAYGTWTDGMESLAKDVLPAVAVDERPLGVFWLSPAFSLILTASPLGAIIDLYVRHESAGKGHALVHGLMCGLVLIATVLVAFVSRGSGRDSRKPTAPPEEDAEIWST